MRKISVLFLCLVLFFAGCSKNENNSPAENSIINQVKTYTVSISDTTGLTLSNVEISIYNNDSKEELVATGRTNSHGVAAFTLIESDDYVVTISGLSDNYTTEELFHFDICTLDIILTYEPHQQAAPDEKVYIGDRVYNYSFKNASGEEFLLYDVLSENKLVILELVYGGTPSEKEIAIFEAIYPLYEDNIEIIVVDRFPETYSLINRAFFPVGFPTTIYISHDGIIQDINAGLLGSEQDYKDLIDKLLAA